MRHEWELKDCVVKTATKVIPKALDTGPWMSKHNVIGKEQEFCLEEFIIHTGKME